MTRATGQLIALQAFDTLKDAISEYCKYGLNPIVIGLCVVKLYQCKKGGDCTSWSFYNIAAFYIKNFRIHVQFYSPHWRRIQLHIDFFVHALVPRILQCFSKFCIKVFISAVKKELL